MGLVVTRRAVPDRAAATAALDREGLGPTSWSAGPGDAFGWHEHGRAKILYCLGGSIEFWDRAGATHRLRPFDRLDLDAGTEHRAVAGPEGVECVEAFR